MGFPNNKNMIVYLLFFFEYEVYIISYTTFLSLNKTETLRKGNQSGYSKAKTHRLRVRAYMTFVRGQAY